MKRLGCFFVVGVLVASAGFASGGKEKVTELRVPGSEHLVYAKYEDLSDLDGGFIPRDLIPRRFKVIKGEEPVDEEREQPLVLYFGVSSLVWGGDGYNPFKDVTSYQAAIFNRQWDQEDYTLELNRGRIDGEPTWIFSWGYGNHHRYWVFIQPPVSKINPGFVLNW
ncbi:hypothetical protein AGMMS49942_05350 [Spirochaetia bacterium]|nr:hypothetical protein AGMMS49942_05350 [Spirochaetia bacterium]